jgi:predicted RNase H-related nuclease YkuK (DUF458 family)
MRQFNWKNTKREFVPDVVQYIKDKMDEYERSDEFIIYIGCDSLPTKKKTAVYSTVICLYRVGKGAQVFYSRERNVPVLGENKMDKMKYRLREEIYRVTDAALMIVDSDLLNDKRIIDYQVHVDVNPNEKFASNLVYKEAVGYIGAMGLSVYTKPDAMAASFVSDAICRGTL